MPEDKIIGRDQEKRALADAMRSPESELVAVYGRRRVGKTYLVREFLDQAIGFELTGLHREPMKRQLANFSNALSQHFSGAPVFSPSSWLEAFEQLKISLEQAPAVRNRAKKQVLFFDEFPWLATRRSGFLAAFEAFWNTFASRRRDLVIVMCGSAASWMIRNVIGGKGGLHNRTTRRIQLEPFSLSETRRYLEYRSINLDDFQIAQLYMAIGGVPQYLNYVQPGESSAQNIERLCFAKHGLLVDEFQHLYSALFENPAHHEAIVRALASRRRGVTRTELLKSASLKSGGAATTALRELIQSGFVHESLPLHSKTKDALYRLSDEYSLFYLNWVERNRSSGNDVWLRKSSGRKYDTWCGYAFETLCLKHIIQIKASLGIVGVETSETSWIHRPKSPNDEGTQIDMVIDRSDHCTNICEMKFSMNPFAIDKRYATELTRKLSVFRQQSRTLNTVFMTLITTHGLQQNDYSRTLVSSEVKLAQLFER